MKAIPFRRLVACLCLSAGPVAMPVRAADPRPSWECLPDDTVAMVRLPQPARFLEIMRERTRFGAVVLGPDRMRKAWGLAIGAWGGANGESAGIEDLERRLAKHGLGPQDLEAAFAGDMGMGMVMRARGDDLPPVTMALAWMEPGTEAAERIVATFHRMLEDAADAEAAPQRVDLEMAGHSVTWVSRPILRAELGEVKVEGGLDAERLAELREELAERTRQAPKVTVGKVHAFLACVGGRLVAGQTFPSTPTNVRIGMQPRAGGLQLNVGQAAAQAPPPADPDRFSGSDEARGIFERFLAAHAGADASPLADVLRGPGMREALPGGETLAEVMLDPRPPLRAAAADARTAKRMAAAGIDTLGPIALRQAFDGGRLRQGLFVTLPAPRAGLCRILDQPCDAAEVPSFVTSEAVDFTQISLDLAGAYRTLKEFLIGDVGEQAANMFASVEAQAQGFMGVEIERMLANLGSRHWIIAYPAQVAAAVREARDRGDDGPVPSADRTAFVWALEDDAPVIALLPKVGPLVQAQVVEEQGFQGVRLPGGLAVFAGQGHLVVAMGGDTLEKTLAGIRNPPAGAASFRESDVPRRGTDLVDLAPARMFAVGDATRTGGMLGELRDVVAAMIPDDVEEGSRELLAKAQRLVPPAEEMQGMFGVGATAMEVNDAGVALRSAWEMPAP